MRYLVSLGIVLLTGCTTLKPAALIGDDGFEVDCSGPAPTTWKSCHNRAEKQCAGKGYELIETSNDNRRGSQQAIELGYRRWMVFRCR